MGVMRPLWKTFLPLALVLPLGAFVAGSLVASAADDPPPRETDRDPRERRHERYADSDPRPQPPTNGPDDSGGDPGLDG